MPWDCRRRHEPRLSEVVALRRSQIDEVRGSVDVVRRLVIRLPIVAVGLIAAAVALAPDRRRMLARAGVGIVVATMRRRRGSRPSVANSTGAETAAGSTAARCAAALAGSAISVSMVATVVHA
jgi:hypothetical protein